MNIKKLKGTLLFKLCLCLTLLVALAALAGCGNSEPAATNSSNDSSAMAETSAPDETDASAPAENTEIGNDNTDAQQQDPAQNQVAQNSETPQHSEYTDDVSFILDDSLRKFHTKDCSEVAAIANPEPYTGTRADLENEGYEPCSICNP